MSVDRLLEVIEKEKKCLARFGDGEFEIILGRERARFQTVDLELGNKLRNALNSKLDNLLIAVANNYSSLDEYTDEAANGIRQYLANDTRKLHMQLLDMDREYYDAYISRPYIMYRDKHKRGASERFRRVISLWDGLDVLMVEGEHTRFGVGNDIFDNVKSVERILTLDKDCYGL